MRSLLGDGNDKGTYSSRTIESNLGGGKLTQNARNLSIQRNWGFSRQAWREVWSTLEHACGTVTECADLWKDVSKNLGKRRALPELLKLLESCGLSWHKSIFFEDQLKSNQSSWLLQPSYDVQHLLSMQGRLPYQNVDLATSNQLQSLIHEASDVEWSVANQYYFKSIASV